MRRLAMLALLFAGAAVRAGTADVGVRVINQVTHVHAGDPMDVTFLLGNTGPDQAQDVVLAIDLPVTPVRPRMSFYQAPGRCTDSPPFRCIFPTLPRADFLGYITLSFTAPSDVPSVTVTASVTSRTSDPNPMNDSASATTSIGLEPDLRVFTTFFDLRVDPDAISRGYIYLFNNGASTAHHVHFDATLDAGTFRGARVSRLGVDCAVNGEHLTCTAGDLAPHSSQYIIFEWVAPDRLTGGDVAMQTNVAGDEADFEDADNHFSTTTQMYRYLVVSNTADEGEGSLRQALLDAEPFCTGPCKIVFRIDEPLPERGWWTIAPKSPLPAIRAKYLILDGATQTAWRGDTNPNGPEIEIDGRLAGDGDGLSFQAGCEVWMRNLAIGGFHGAGILLNVGTFCPEARLFPSRLIERNLIGTDATGNVANPNDRGIVVGRTFGYTLRENVISGNRLTGIFLAPGGYLQILRNVIGAGADGRPLGNGKSGIFIADDGGYGDIVGNTIAYNGQFGIAESRKARETAFRGNSIKQNGSLGIDIGLDLVTPNVAHDDDPAKPNAPVLFSAFYDAATDTTLVRGRLDSDVDNVLPEFAVEVFASESVPKALAQGETLVGSVKLTNGHSDFEVRIKGNQTGKFITATNTRSYYNGFARTPRPDDDRDLITSRPEETSEFSNILLVQ